MKKELQQKLYDKYPKIFRQKDLPMTQTCMCWGLNIGDGWYSLIDKLCHQIQWRIDNPAYERTKCISNWIKENILEWCLRKLNNLMYKLARLIAREKRETGFRAYTMEQWNARKAARPRISNWLEDVANKLPNIEYKMEEIKISQVEATQVKEKFGSMRFYYGGGDEHIRGMVSFAEAMSGSICERCGIADQSVGQTSGWIVTICNKCRKKDDRYKKSEWKTNEDWNKAYEME